MTQTEREIKPRVEKMQVDQRSWFWVAVEDILRGWLGDADWCATREAKVEYLNTAKRPANDYKDLVDSISQHGFRYPVYIDPQMRELKNGHHRLLVALDLGFTHVPVTYDYHSAGWGDYHGMDW